MKKILTYTGAAIIGILALGLAAKALIGALGALALLLLWVAILASLIAFAKSQLPVRREW